MKSIKPFLMIFSILILAGLACLSSGSEQTASNNSNDIGLVDLSGVPLGRWQVTELSGFITDERTGGGLDILCDYYLNTYQAILDSEDTSIELMLMAEPSDTSNLPDGLVDVNYLEGLDGVFSFRFAFDNGYYTNSMVTSVPTQFVYFSLMPEVWSFDIGYWGEGEIFAKNHNGSPGGGINFFVVAGSFDGPEKISGTWSFDERTALPDGVAPECASTAIGSGSWAAEGP